MSAQDAKKRLSAMARERSDIAQAAIESLSGVDIDHPALDRDLIEALLEAIESEADAELASNYPARDNPEALDHLRSVLSKMVEACGMASHESSIDADALREAVAELTGLLDAILAEAPDGAGHYVNLAKYTKSNIPVDIAMVRWLITVFSLLLYLTRTIAQASLGSRRQNDAKERLERFEHPISEALPQMPQKPEPQSDDDGPSSTLRM